MKGPLYCEILTPPLPKGGKEGNIILNSTVIFLNSYKLERQRIFLQVPLPPSLVASEDGVLLLNIDYKTTCWRTQNFMLQQFYN